VAPRAAAWRPPARVAAARSRLLAMAAHNTQPELAPRCPEVISSSAGSWVADLRGSVVVSVVDTARRRVAEAARRGRPHPADEPTR
jgi:hypothetical protein